VCLLRNGTPFGNARAIRFKGLEAMPAVSGAEGAKDHVGQSNPYCSKGGNDMSYLRNCKLLSERII
jgi:hypothetical protein